jgi:DNA-binding CsgD family transcriptional regulator
MSADATNDEVKRLVAEGKLTPKQIAFRCGVSVGLVKRLMKKPRGK